MEHNLYRYILRRSLRWQVFMVVTIFALGFLNPYTLLLTKQTINSIREMQLQRTLILLLWYLGAVLATGALKYLRQNLEGIVQETLLRDMRSELYDRMLRFPLPFMRNTTASQLTSMLLAETEALGDFFGEAFSVPLYHGLIFAGSVAFMVWQNPWMALIALVLFPVQVWLVRKLQRRVIKLSRERVNLFRSLSDRVQEAVGGLQEIQANDTLAYESSGFREPLRKTFKVRIRIYNLKYLVKWFNNFNEKLGVFLLLLVGGYLIIRHPGSLDLGGLVAFIEAYKQLNEPWREIIGYIQDRDNAKVNYEQVLASFDPPELRPEFTLDERLPDPAVQLAGAYEVRGASLTFDDRTKALDRVHLSTLPRERVAVLGAPGSGKSALAMVLAKLYGYTGSALLDQTELHQIPAAVAGRQIAYVGNDVRLFTGPVFDNLAYGLRHRPAGGGAPNGHDPDDAGAEGDGAAWLDLSLAGVADQPGLVEAVLACARLVGLDEDLFLLGLRSRIDPATQPDIAERLVRARALVMERFAHEGAEPSVEFFDPHRFALYLSIGENILFGYSADPALAPDRLASHAHFRRVAAEVGLREPLIALGEELAREMVEIFKDIPSEHELFANFSLITAGELPEYTRILTQLDRRMPLSPEDQQCLIDLALRLIPARHRLGHIDDAFQGKIVAARQRFAETMPAGEGFAPYDLARYFAHGTLLENLLFGKVVATSSQAVKKVNASVEEVIATHDLRRVVMEAGLHYDAGRSGGRLSHVQRQKVGVARALLKRPQVLILDDALGALDAATRGIVHQRILDAMKGRTLITVLTDPALARHYDRVVTLEAGRVAQIGSYAELAAADGLLRQWLTQAGALT